MFKNPHRPERIGSYTPSETTVGTCEWGIFIIPTTTRRFKPWPFYPQIVEGRDSPFERVTFSPSQKGVTSRIARKGLFSKTSKGDSTCSNIIPPGLHKYPKLTGISKTPGWVPSNRFFPERNVHQNTLKIRSLDSRMPCYSCHQFAKCYTRLDILRIIGPSYRGVWMRIVGVWDLQTTCFEIPWFL